MTTMIEDEHTCERKPKSIRIYRSHFAGNLVAECESCKILFGYWECACDFHHDCKV
jgi:hypothetical protein